MGVLDKKVCIITGGAGSVGLASARLFVREGARVMLVDLRESDLARAAGEIGGAGVVTRAADVTKAGDMVAMAAAAIERHGGIDILCANAGIFPMARLADMTADDWDQVMATNLRGTFLPIKACLPHLKKSDQGRVVITSSITGSVTGFPGWSHYGATKAGQLGFMRTVAIEDVGAGALYLLSDLGRGVTGEILHIDAGYHVVGMKAEDAPDISVVKE